MNMRICVIGDFSNNLDEGYKNIAHYLTKELSNHHEILKLNVKKIFTFEFWQDLENFSPQIVHYLTAPTISSFFVLKLISIRLKNTKTVMSALHPQLFPFSDNLIRFLKPDKMLIQSYEDKIRFEKAGLNVKFLSNGVDINKFVEINPEMRQLLRKKYGIRKDTFVILHVGHIRQGRNLQIIPKIVGKDDQVLIVASTYMKSNKSIYDELKKAGCTIWMGYMENIEQVYAICDCYVFPVLNNKSILTPLSVLEAMSCNIPVVTTKFAGLSAFFEEGAGFYFAESENDFSNAIKDLKSEPIKKFKNREKVLAFSWKNIAEQVVEIYEEMSKK
jgi:glycosyltransferase involved in cell wall biosynthesis